MDNAYKHRSRPVHSGVELARMHFVMSWAYPICKFWRIIQVSVHARLWRFISAHTQLGVHDAGWRTRSIPRKSCGVGQILPPCTCAWLDYAVLCTSTAGKVY